LSPTKRVPYVGQPVTYYPGDGTTLDGKVTYVWSLDKVAIMATDGVGVQQLTSVLWLLPEASPPANQPYAKP
jgi:hypothetical protein